MITHGKEKVLIDPIFKNSKTCVPKVKGTLLTQNKIKDPSLILITNEMQEHFDKKAVEEIALKNNATVVAPDIVLNDLTLPRNLKYSIDGNKEFVLKGVKIEVQTAHYPKSFFPAGYLLTMGKKKIFHAGATKLIDSLGDVVADVALLPMNKQSMDIVDVVRAAKMMKPKKLIPMQHDTLVLQSDDPKDLEKRIKDSVLKTETIILKPGKKMRV